MTDIPKTMKRLVVTAPGTDVATCKIEVQEVPVPEPSSNEVLIKVAAAPINPSDYGTWFRCRPEQCPFAMGKEGSGVVVKAGGAVSSFAHPVGSKVGFCRLEKVWILSIRKPIQDRISRIIIFFFSILETRKLLRVRDHECSDWSSLFFTRRCARGRCGQYVYQSLHGHWNF